jgi:hypothetical protein
MNVLHSPKETRIQPGALLTQLDMNTDHSDLEGTILYWAV